MHKASSIDDKLLKLAQSIIDYFLHEKNSGDEFSIFLCGSAKATPSSIREPIKKIIEQKNIKYQYRIYYPETLFIELLLGHRKHDLLSLENLLASSVNAVAIILESPGTLTELGAFANHEILAKKLIVIENKKYAFDRSFVNLGPLRHLKKNKLGRVFSADFSTKNIGSIANKICEFTREISLSSPIENTIDNPIAAYRIYLALIYVLDPIPRTNVLEVVKSSSRSTAQTEIAADTIINTLISEKKISESLTGLTILDNGVDALLFGERTKEKNLEVFDFLSETRTEALNINFRRRRKFRWGRNNT